MELWQGSTPCSVQTKTNKNMGVFRIIVVEIFPILLALYLIIDVFVPSFSKKQYFWFVKSFKKKSKVEEKPKTENK